MSCIIENCADHEAYYQGISTREMTACDLVLALEWLNARIRKNHAAAPDFPADWLPQTGLAAIARSGTVLAVATLYLDKTSPVAVCGWVVSNLENTSSCSKKAIELLMLDMQIYAKNQGAKYLLSTFGNKGINHILDQQGFSPGEVCDNKFIYIGGE